VSPTTAPPTMGAERPLSPRRILSFYMPLVLNAALLALAGPILNLGVARGHGPTLELAAFWIAFAIVVFAQSACLVFQPLTVTLLDRRAPLATLATAALAVGLAATAIVLAVALTPLGDLVFHGLIPTRVPTARLARTVLVLLSPLPMLVALRGVANGVAVVARRTPLLATATLVRVITLAGVVAVAIGSGRGVGAIGAAWALVIGTAIETLFVVGATRPDWRGRLRDPRPRAGAGRHGVLLGMGAPLLVTTLMWTLTRPVVSAILGRLPDPDLAQAAFGVLLPVVLVTCSPVWSLLEVGLVLPRDRADLGALIRFAAATALVFALAIGVVTLTPLRDPVLRLAFHLPPELERAVAPAFALLPLAPLFLAARALAQAMLMNAGRTGILLALSPVKILLMVATGLAVIAARPGVNGALVAIGLLLGGDLVDAVLYGLAARRALASADAHAIPLASWQVRRLALHVAPAATALADDGAPSERRAA